MKKTVIAVGAMLATVAAVQGVWLLGRWLHSHSATTVKVIKAR